MIFAICNVGNRRERESSKLYKLHEREREMERETQSHSSFLGDLLPIIPERILVCRPTGSIFLGVRSLDIGLHICPPLTHRFLHLIKTSASATGWIKTH